MFSLVLTTCFSGAFCVAATPAVEYPSLRRCLIQAGIIAGMARADMPMIFRWDQTTRIQCTGPSGTTYEFVLPAHVKPHHEFPDPKTLPQVS
jgi:hypothetical protein